MFPKLLQSLLLANEFKVVRAKNRLSTTYDPRDSAGYRDYQLLVRTADGWIVELQIIAERMLQLKNELGHSEYTHFRFLVEAGLRARAKTLGRASGETAIYNDASASGSVPARITPPMKCARGDVAGGRKCSKLAEGGGKFCDGHTCKTTGCLTTKSSGDDACGIHALYTNNDAYVSVAGGTTTNA